jgi:Domain of unknown function (DUF6285)
MPRSLPDDATLLKAAAKYLEEELLPTLTDYHRFQTRVTVNVLNLIRRELELYEGQSSAERKRLAAILGHDDDVAALNLELSKRIRGGAVAIDDPALRSHIRQSLADALAINNPRWPGR